MGTIATLVLAEVQDLLRCKTADAVRYNPVTIDQFCAQAEKACDGLATEIAKAEMLKVCGLMWLPAPAGRGAVVGQAPHNSPEYNAQEIVALGMVRLANRVL